jgi:hypothetical protein
MRRMVSSLAPVGCMSAWGLMGSGWMISCFLLGCPIVCVALKSLVQWGSTFVLSGRRVSAVG